MVTRPDKKSAATHVILSCIDYRHVDDIVAAHYDLRDTYDHLIVPGASLGVLQKTYPEWGKAFWSQLRVARSLHQRIETFIILEHMDCGAYRELLNGGADLDRDTERRHHEEQALRLEQQLRSRAKWLKRIERRIMTPEMVTAWMVEPLAGPKGARTARRKKAK